MTPAHTYKGSNSKAFKDRHTASNAPPLWHITFSTAPPPTPQYQSRHTVPWRDPWSNLALAKLSLMRCWQRVWERGHLHLTQLCHHRNDAALFRWWCCPEFADSPNGWAKSSGRQRPWANTVTPCTRCLGLGISSQLNTGAVKEKPETGVKYLDLITIWLFSLPTFTF